MFTSIVIIYFLFSVDSLTGGSGQQCCYDNVGNLLIGAPGGGSVDFVSQDVNPTQHHVVDIEAQILCCKGAFPDCNKYYERRPSDDGSRFNPPLPGTTCALSIADRFLHFHFCSNLLL